MKTLFRYICCVLYYGFVRWLPTSYLPGCLIFKTIRYQICRHMFASCGKNVNIERRADFRTGKQITIGDNSRLGENCKLVGKVTIGKNVIMGPNCILWTRNHAFDRMDIPMLEQGFYDEQPIVIGDDVWIGGMITILPGFTIGEGSIVGACAVVTKDVPEYAIVVGNPARLIKSRK